jgi:E3 ubiquitin-protein ligase DOA10
MPLKMTEKHYIYVCVCVYNKVLCKGMMMVNVVCRNVQLVIRNEGVFDGIANGKVENWIGI